MSKNNGNHDTDEAATDPAPLINDNTIRYLHTIIDILSAPDEFESLMTTIRASTRGKEATEMHTRVRGWHYTFINAGVVSILTKWEEILHLYAQRNKEKREPIDVERIDWLLEANQAVILAERDALEQMETPADV